jgi:tetratricopeptide (TPR) repeat protein
MTHGTYTLKEVQSLLGIPQSVITGLISAGFIIPTRGRRREYRFTFQDVVMLRTAQSLRAANIPNRKILRSLRRLKEAWQDDQPLSAIRITAVGQDVTVEQGGARWHALTGQMLFDLDGQRPNSSVADFGSRALKNETQEPGTYWFQRALDLEEVDPYEAKLAYRKAISADPTSIDAYLNLGCMLCDSGHCAEAIALFREALRHLPEEPLLRFNLGVALEDAGQYREALEAYDECIALAPDFADAHFNAARLHEELGDQKRAIRHFNQYRKLNRQR